MNIDDIYSQTVLIQFKSFFLLLYFAMLIESVNDLEVNKMKKNNKAKIIRVGMILMLLSSVFACGQKGDLYLLPEADTFISDFFNTD